MHAMHKVKRMASKDWDLLSQRSAVGNVLNILHSLSHNLIGTVCTSDLSNRLSSLSNALKWREMQLTVQKNHLEPPAVWAIIKPSTTNIMQFFFFFYQPKKTMDQTVTIKHFCVFADLLPPFSWTWAISFNEYIINDHKCLWSKTVF